MNTETVTIKIKELFFEETFQQKNVLHINMKLRSGRTWNELKKRLNKGTYICVEFYNKCRNDYFLYNENYFVDIRDICMAYANSIKTTYKCSNITEVDHTYRGEEYIGKYIIFYLDNVIRISMFEIKY